jgi:hypothetical protein
MGAGVARTTEGRLTSELILRGDQALRDKAVKTDAAQATGWRAEIAAEIGDAYTNQEQRDAVIEAAFLIRAGLEAEGGGNNRQAVSLATGGIVERNGRKVPLPYGITANDFDKKLRALTLANVAGATSLPAKPAGQIEPGNIDLSKRPVVPNADGSISTVRSINVGIDGAEVLIPTVSDDGKVLSEEKAVDLYLRTGKHLGKFKTPAAASAYAKQVSQHQAQGVVMVGGAAMPLADFLARVPEAQLIHAGQGRYAVSSGSGVATDLHGRPIVLEVK